MNRPAKTDGLFKHIALTFGIALLVYVIAYRGIEHRRTRQGPWQITFTNDVSGAPALVINQPALGITNAQIIFTGEPAPGTNVTLIFTQPRAVPFAVPFGHCLFMDTTFLPGTLALELFGHEVQLIPRVLTVDNIEQPWRSDAVFSVSGTNRLQSPPPPTTNK